MVAEKVMVWLDDTRMPPEGYLYFRTSSALIVYLSHHWDEIEELDLDHDLGGDDTGMKVLEYIENMVVFDGARPMKLHVHSANPVARERMLSSIELIFRLDSEAYGQA